MTREAPRQFALDLPHDARLGEEDYLVGSANASAYELVLAWPGWPDAILLLTGDEGAGKTHLAGIWLDRADGLRAPDAKAALDALVADGADAVLLEDVEGQDETTLFHLLNAAREHGASLLMTARTTPTLLWPALPDLASRLRALPVARLESPDEAMVRAVLVKLLHDRQLVVDDDVVEFITRRCDRSLGAARRLVGALDRESLARGRSVGRGLASDVIAKFREDED